MKEKTDEHSGHYVIASSRPPERRTLEHRTLKPIQSVFDGSFEGVSGNFQGHFKGISTKIKETFQGDSREFQGYPK